MSLKDKIISLYVVLIIIGTTLALGVGLFWSLYPYQVANVETPIPILNENKEIAIGEPIIMKIAVTKANNTDSHTEKFIICDDGNLVTLAGGSNPLPAGSYTVTSTSNLLPDKVTVGTTCTFTFQVHYDVNPIREIIRTWTSEEFKVV